MRRRTIRCCHCHQIQEARSFRMSMPQPLSTMFVSHVLSFLSLYTGAYLAKPLQVATQNIQSPSVSANLINAALTSNLSSSVPTLNTSAENAFSIECNGALYGFNPSISDCEGAAQSINPDLNQLTWGERHTGLPADTFNLPFAIFGGKARAVRMLF